MSLYSQAIRQLLLGAGRMAELGSEDGVLKLDWVEGVARLLADTDGLERVEREAVALRARGIKHVIWAGMGGSVMAVRVLVDLGFGGGDYPDAIRLHPLDSTDPVALNTVVEQLRAARDLPIPGPSDAVDRDWLRALLGDVVMVAVAMGMTSEEPITHLQWFTELLAMAGLDAHDHCLVMALPDSFLDRFAQEHGIPRQPLQLDGGTGTGGRMSAPATRVFLFPAALWLTGQKTPGRLRTVLQQAWDWYDLEGAEAHPADHPFVQLAGALSEHAVDGAVTLLLDLKAPQPTAGPDLSALLPWIEQLMEESLGKQGKGVMVFSNQMLAPDARYSRDAGVLQVSLNHRRWDAGRPDRPSNAKFVLDAPGYWKEDGAWERLTAPEQLSAVAAHFLGWQLTMALFGYQQDITFAGQPAVEDYKARARALRQQGDPVSIAQISGTVVRESGLVMIGPPKEGMPLGSISERLVDCLTRSHRLLYLDVTINGDISAAWLERLQAQVLHLANRRLGIPGRVRSAPAAYHSTEQSEMDGPQPLMSLRILWREHPAVTLGTYDSRFLEAQAVGTWQAMVEHGNTCFLLVVEGDAASAEAAVQRVLRQVSESL